MSWSKPFDKGYQVIHTNNKLIYVKWEGEYIHPYKEFPAPVGVEKLEFDNRSEDHFFPSREKVTSRILTGTLPDSKQVRLFDLEGRPVHSDYSWYRNPLWSNISDKYVGFRRESNELITFVTAQGELFPDPQASSELKGFVVSPLWGHLFGEVSKDGKTYWKLYRYNGEVVIDKLMEEPELVEVDKQGRAKLIVFKNNNIYESWGQVYRSKPVQFAIGASRNEVVAKGVSLAERMKEKNDNAFKAWAAERQRSYEKFKAMATWKEKAESIKAGKDSAEQLENYERECRLSGQESSICSKFAEGAKAAAASSSGSYSGYKGGIDYNRAQFSISNQHSIQRMKANTSRLRGR